MPTTDTSEKGLELIIVKALTGLTDEQILRAPTQGVRESASGFGGQGYLLGRPQDFDRDHVVDTYHLFEFIRRTQPKAYERLSLGSDGNPRLQFLARLQQDALLGEAVDIVGDDAARVDGASWFPQTWHVTVPMISGALFFVFIVDSIAAFQSFTEAYTAFFGSGNTTYSNDAALFYAIYLFQQAFEFLHMGYASAMAWVLFAIIMVITFVQIRVTKRFVFLEGDQK